MIKVSWDQSSFLTTKNIATQTIYHPSILHYRIAWEELVKTLKILLFATKRLFKTNKLIHTEICEIQIKILMSFEWQFQTQSFYITLMGRGTICVSNFS